MATAQLNSEALAITPIDLLRQAITQGVSIDQLERLQAMHERWEANEARKAYCAAMNAFKTEAPTITKNKHVKIEPKDSSKRGAEYDHATLDQVCDQVIPALARHDLSHDWKTEQKGESITVTCILTHVGGHYEARSLTGSPDNTGVKNSGQAIASTVTFFERYTLLMVCGLAVKGIDNDGRGVTLEAGLPQEQVDKLCAEIANAPNEPELRRVFFAAYRAAEAAKDRGALPKFVRAKDQRKKEIQ